MPLTSNYANGAFYDGKWFCGCGLEVSWRTSGTEKSKGEKFASCPKIRGQQCGFFLTEDSDATARAEKRSDIPPAPRTPTGTRIGGISQSLLTPETGLGLNRSLLASGSSREVYHQRFDGTPTPRRFRADENGNLASFVFDLLQKDGVVLKSSTESTLRYVIGDRIAGYEAKLQNLVESLEMAFKKIDDLEKRDSSAIS